jgi:hypothetical protein
MPGVVLHCRRRGLGVIATDVVSGHFDDASRFRLGNFDRFVQGDCFGGGGVFGNMRNEATVFLELAESGERFVEAALGS